MLFIKVNAWSLAINSFIFSLKLLLSKPAVNWFEVTFLIAIFIWLLRLSFFMTDWTKNMWSESKEEFSVKFRNRWLKYFDGESCNFLFIWNPNFTVGKKCGWLSCSQNLSLVNDSWHNIFSSRYWYKFIFTWCIY